MTDKEELNNIREQYEMLLDAKGKIESKKIITEQEKEYLEEIKSFLKDLSNELNKLYGMTEPRKEKSPKQLEIKNIRKPKIIEKIINKLRQDKMFVTILITIITKNKKNDYERPEELQLVESNINNYLNNIISKQQQSEQSEIINPLNIGTKVIVRDNSKIYKNAQDSLFETNPYKPYYSNYSEERTILGISIQCDSEIINIFACDSNSKLKVDNLLNRGGEIKSLLLGNIEHDYYLKRYNGEQITVDDINDKAEGWYSINDIDTIIKGSGYKK